MWPPQWAPALRSTPQSLVKSCKAGQSKTAFCPKGRGQFFIVQKLFCKKVPCLIFPHTNSVCFSAGGFRISGQHSYGCTESFVFRKKLCFTDFSVLQRTVPHPSGHWRLLCLCIPLIYLVPKACLSVPRFPCHGDGGHHCHTNSLKPLSLSYAQQKSGCKKIKKAVFPMSHAAGNIRIPAIQTEKRQSFIKPKWLTGQSRLIQIRPANAVTVPRMLHFVTLSPKKAADIAVERIREPPFITG